MRIRSPVWHGITPPVGLVSWTIASPGAVGVRCSGTIVVLTKAVMSLGARRLRVVKIVSNQLPSICVLVPVITIINQCRTVARVAWVCDGRPGLAVSLSIVGAQEAVSAVPAVRIIFAMVRPCRVVRTPRRGGYGIVLRVAVAVVVADGAASTHTGTMYQVVVRSILLCCSYNHRRPRCRIHGRPPNVAVVACSRVKSGILHNSVCSCRGRLTRRRHRA